MYFAVKFNNQVFGCLIKGDDITADTVLFYKLFSVELFGLEVLPKKGFLMGQVLS
jgi:hypothetical protein